jgi:hypothetical protein
MSACLDIMAIGNAAVISDEFKIVLQGFSWLSWRRRSLTTGSFVDPFDPQVRFLASFGVRV